MCFNFSLLANVEVSPVYRTPRYHCLYYLTVSRKISFGCYVYTIPKVSVRYSIGHVSVPSSAGDTSSEPGADMAFIDSASYKTTAKAMMRNGFACITKVSSTQQLGIIARVMRHQIRRRPESPKGGPV